MIIPANEYAPFYQTYINQLEEEPDLVDALRANLLETKEVLNCIPLDKTTFSYAPQKWTVAELIGHVLETERIMAYRALRISRGDTTPLPGFDENAYVASGVFRSRSLASLSEEFTTIRHATISLFANLPDTAWLLSGTASNSPVSVRALAGIIVGHTRHHLQILQERYL